MAPGQISRKRLTAGSNCMRSAKFHKTALKGADSEIRSTVAAGASPACPVPSGSHPIQRFIIITSIRPVDTEKRKHKLAHQCHWKAVSFFLLFRFLYWPLRKRYKKYTNTNRSLGRWQADDGNQKLKILHISKYLKMTGPVGQ